jgi:hypothetical protein
MRPLSEELFGKKGVRYIHYLFYVLTFGTSSAAFAVVYGVLFTAIMMLLGVVGMSEWTVALGDENLKMVIETYFIQSLTDLRLIGVSLFSGASLTLVIVYLNEVRYRRGEWVRTFL